MCKSLKIVQTLNQPNCHCYPDHGYIDSSHLNHSNPQLQPFLLKLQAWIKLIRLWWFCWIIPQIQEFWVNFGLVLYTVTQTARFQVSPQQRACQNGLSDKARQYVENMPLLGKCSLGHHLDDTQYGVFVLSTSFVVNIHCIIIILFWERCEENLKYCLFYICEMTLKQPNLFSTWFPSEFSANIPNSVCVFA